tara:strand:- start:661 stop:1137 length:477 start_codon:yes stop_codon:yes gene_type:complete
MNSKVVVLANEKTKAVVNVNENKPDYGYIMVAQSKIVTGSNGWLDVKRVTAVVPGNMEKLTGAGFYEGQELPGKIRTQESLEPFSDVNIEKQMKRAGGENAPVCTLMGKPIYQQRTWTVDANLEDELIAHDNKDEIRAYNASKADAVTQQNEDFSIGG